MKITVINGNTRMGNTWHCMDLFRQELSKYEELTVSEFFMPKDMPDFCIGCYSCFFGGEQTCPHADRITPIVQALKDADLIILTSPVYSFDVTGHMKALFDHLCFLWISHRPDPGMFHKVALAVVTTAGAGLRHTMKTMKNTLSFWGIKRIFTYRRVVAAPWEKVPQTVKLNIRKQIERKAKRIAKTVKKIDRLTYPPIRRLMFGSMRKMMIKNTWNPYDRSYWETFGWLGKKKPF